MIEGQVGEHPAGQVARQEPEDGDIVLVRDLDQDLGDVGRIELRQGVPQNIPVLLLDKLLQIWPKEGPDHATLRLPRKRNDYASVDVPQRNTAPARSKNDSGGRADEMKREAETLSASQGPAARFHAGPTSQLDSQ